MLRPIHSAYPVAAHVVERSRVGLDVGGAEEELDSGPHAVEGERRLVSRHVRLRIVAAQPLLLLPRNVAMLSMVMALRMSHRLSQVTALLISSPQPYSKKCRGQLFAFFVNSH